MRPTPNSLRAFLFDLDGTIRFTLPTGYETFFQYTRDLGLTFSPEDARRTERWLHRFWADRHTINRLFEELGREAGWLEITSRQLKTLGVTGPLEEYSRAINDRFAAEYKPEIHTEPEARATLVALRERGYVTALVSNRSEALGPLAEEHNLADLFDFTLAAVEAGSWKPEAGIFQRAVEMAGVPAQAAAYVGDNYFADIVGSANAGLVPILYDPRGLFPEAECRVIRSLGDLREL